MPCLLKLRSDDSPGIITFTHNEVLHGVVAKQRKVQEFLKKSSQAKEWIFGVHIQGDCTHLPAWPRDEWQSFFMWPNREELFLSNIPSKDITPLTCVNFLPKPTHIDILKSWDICVISRPSEIKRIKETLLIIRELLNLKEDLTVVFIVPDPRNLELGAKVYQHQGVDPSYFELPIKIFNSKQLKQISFISSSQQAFGSFPIANSLIADIICRSRFLLLTSHKEGVPRVIAESFVNGTPCIVSKQLISGLNGYMTEENTIFIDDDVKMAAREIMIAFENYSRFKVDPIAMQRIFCEDWHKIALQEFLSEKITSTGLPIKGVWCLHELNLRLACHGHKYNLQFMNNGGQFFEWVSRVEECTGIEPDEDYLFSGLLSSNYPIAVSSNQMMKRLKERFFRWTSN